jgi:hypothetical protein
MLSACAANRNRQIRTLILSILGKPAPQPGFDRANERRALLARLKKVGNGLITAIE